MEKLEDLLRNIVQTQTGDPMARMLNFHLSSGGKRIRSQLLLECAEALGVDSEQALFPAAACELLHNATLIHDDLQDGDKIRRGYPTLWTTEGSSQAINAGDMMLMLPFSAISRADIPEALKWQLSLGLAEAAQKVVLGQALEPDLYGYFHKPQLLQEYLRCIEGKTGALFTFAIEAACTMAGQTQRIESLRGPFLKLGILFQLQDDVLDLYGNKGRGRVGEDLREGKISLLVVEYLQLVGVSSPQVEKLLKFLKTPREESANEAVEYWIQAFREGGTLSAALSRIGSYKAEIQKTLSGEGTISHVVERSLEKILGPLRNLNQ